MPIQYVSVEEAVGRSGLRMVVVGGVPSPWGEAAKDILYIKGIEWAAVRLVYDSDALKAWAGQRSGPIAIYENERPRHGWAEIPSAWRRRHRCSRPPPPSVRWSSASPTSCAAKRGSGGRDGCS